MTATIQVFDPAMCCSTGICGPSIDPALVRFAADLEWLGEQGVSVERFNLSQQPQAFVAQPLVTKAIELQGEAALPTVLCCGAIKSTGVYPSRAQLAAWAGIEAGVSGKPPLSTEPHAEKGSCCGPKGCC